MALLDPGINQEANFQLSGSVSRHAGVVSVAAESRLRATSYPGCYLACRVSYPNLQLRHTTVRLPNIHFAALGWRGHCRSCQSARLSQCHPWRHSSTFSWRRLPPLCERTCPSATVVISNKKYWYIAKQSLAAHGYFSLTNAPVTGVAPGN